jgi:hypothetical protein
MRNIDRIEPFLETVRSVWEEHPDIRNYKGGWV